jgi:glycosyltransferase involved in cell wall biosynthesis
VGVQPLVSIVVNNYNYGRFIGEAIDSALAQTYANCEVIVVDDGSTDGSRAVIERFGDRVIRVFQDNGGQGAAMNAGFARSRGAIILFLDSDDVLEPRAVERTVEMFAPGTDRVQFALQLVDEQGKPLGRQFPARGASLPSGRLADQIASGPIANTPPTSGNAFSRDVLSKILPMPVPEWRICADSYLLVVSALHGAVAATDEALGRYRVHGNNNWSGSGAPSVDQLLRVFDNERRKVAALRAAAVDAGMKINPSWELANPTYLDLRLYMFVHHADRHPFPQDSLWRLAGQGLATSLSQRPAGVRAALKCAFYGSLPLLPSAARRVLTRWRVSPQSRPGFLRRS